MIAVIIAIAVQLEAAGGIAQSMDSYAQNAPLVPAVEARAAIRVHESWAVGGAFLAVLGPDAAIKTNCGSFSNDPAFKAYVGLLSVRAQSTGTVRFWAEGAAGVGHLIRLRGLDCVEHPALGGRGAPVFQLSAGVRVAVSSSLALGLQLSWVRWNGVELPAGAGPFADAPSASGLSTDAYLLFATVTFDLLPWGDDARPAASLADDDLADAAIGEELRQALALIALQHQRRALDGAAAAERVLQVLQ